MVIPLKARMLLAWAVFVFRTAHCELPKLSDLIKSDACANSTDGSIVCSVSGTLLLSGLDSPLSQPLTLRANPAGGGSIVLHSASPLVIASVGSLTLQGVTVMGIVFSESPLNPALSLAWSGITLQPGAQLTVTSSVLVLDCPTWNSLPSALCEFGQAPRDSSQVSEGSADPAAALRVVEGHAASIVIPGRCTSMCAGMHSTGAGRGMHACAATKFCVYVYRYIGTGRDGHVMHGGQQ